MKVKASPTHYYYQGELSDLKCKFKSCQQKGGLVLSTINVDYSCEYCGRWQNILLDEYYQPVLKIKNNKH